MYFLDRAIHQTLIDQMLLLQFSKYLISNINLTNTIYQKLFSELLKRLNHLEPIEHQGNLLVNPSGSWKYKVLFCFRNKKKEEEALWRFQQFPQSWYWTTSEERGREGRLAAGLDNQSEPEKLTALAGGCISRGLYRAQFIIWVIITNLNLD